MTDEYSSVERAKFKPSPETRELFHDPWIKFRMANEHISKLQSILFNNALDEFIKIKYYELNEKHEKMRAFVRDPEKAEYSGIIGDAVHNLRCCLDLAICTVARAKGLDDSKFYFPFSKTEDLLESNIKKAGIYKLGDHWAEFVKNMRPYKGGSDLFYEIHDMDRVDKHRSITPCYSVMGNSFVNISGNFGTMTWPVDDAKVVNGEIIGRFPPIPREATRVTFIGQLKLVFPEYSAMPGRDVIPTLVAFSNRINFALPQFERIFQQYEAINQ